MNHLHTIAIDFQDIAKLKAGEALELLNNTVLVYAGVTRARRLAQTSHPDESNVAAKKAKKAAYNKQYRLLRLRRERAKGQP